MEAKLPSSNVAFNQRTKSKIRFSELYRILTSAFELAFIFDVVFEPSFIIESAFVSDSDFDLAFILGYC